MSKFPLSTIRHSAAHVLAQAVQVFYKDAKLAIGPAIDDGFYYDFDVTEPITEENLEKIEQEMQRIIKEGQEFKQYNLTAEDAKEQFKRQEQSYKCEIIDELDVNEVSIYENGPFIDLCRGPHVDNTHQIGAIKLLKVSGAYWRGSEKNKMLQRIYGTAFYSPKELKKYLHQLEEAKKRDHRKIGKELQLFSIQEDIGGGLVLWHPKGAAIRQVIEDLWRGEHQKQGYDIVYSPHIGMGDLWKTSGHLDFYEDGMFSSMDIDSTPYFIRPMNCPFHISIYQQQQVSYRDLPIRYAELGTVYRYERSGVLHGLMRVRGFTQDDAHIFCTEEQVKSEVIAALSFSLSMLATFGFTDYAIYLSTRPEEKYVGEPNEWKVAESALEEALKDMDISYDIDEGGGAFYGPKIDIKIKDSIGRDWQCSTIQFDFNLPTRFNISYINSNGEKQRPYMIHRALLGSIERFFGILIEHYAGKFPVWLAPVQLRLMFLVKECDAFKQDVIEACKAHGVRFDIDETNEKLGYKVRKAQLEKIPMVGIIGEKELQEKNITIRYRDTKNQSIYSIQELIKEIVSSDTNNTQEV
jgi:threonyl-tRNA synthetase